jgi:hypothetical protein
VIAFASVALIVFTLIRGVDLLGATEPPRDQAEAPAVGFLAPKAPKPGRGFALGMAIEVTTCDQPVHVTLVAAGTAEYWRDHHFGGPFKLGIPGRHVANLRVGLAENTNSVINPIDNERPKDRPPGWDVSRVQNMTVVSGHVPVERDVLVSFDATNFDRERHWLEERGQGTCYLRLPALSGNFTAFATEQARGAAFPAPDEAVPPALEGRWFARYGKCIPQISERVYAGHKLAALYCPRFEIVHGSVAVRAVPEHEGGRAGTVLSNESLPEPDTVVEGDPVWSCRSDPRGDDPVTARLELQQAGLGSPMSADRLDRELAPNCSGFVAVTESNAGERRDVTLILIGIGIALGLGALVELMMRWIEVEFPLRHREPPDGP